MDPADRAGADDLRHFRALIADPTRHHLFHALRVIEARYRDAPRLGESRRAAQDRVRLGQVPELAFPTTTITAFQPAEEGEPGGEAGGGAAGGAGGERGAPGRLTNQFFGLFGPHGPLPLHLTEYARDRLRNRRDPTLVAFADMLTHRLMGLLYRAWAAGQPAVAFDRAWVADAGAAGAHQPDADGEAARATRAAAGLRASGRGTRARRPGRLDLEKDPLQRKVAALAGYGTGGMDLSDAMPDLLKRRFAGRLGAGPKNAEGLRALLAAFFEMPVEIRQFVGEWLRLEPSDRWRMGARGANGGLGQGSMLGSRVWSRDAKFRIRLGPLDLADYRRLLPGRGALERLESIVRNYVGDRLDWDVQLVLRAEEVPRAALGAQAGLGYNIWAGRRRDMDSDAEDLVLTPPSRTAAARALAGHGMATGE